MVSSISTANVRAVEAAHDNGQEAGAADEVQGTLHCAVE
jgi:hypothetical protein